MKKDINREEDILREQVYEMIHRPFGVNLMMLSGALIFIFCIKSYLSSLYIFFLIFISITYFLMRAFSYLFWNETSKTRIWLHYLCFQAMIGSSIYSITLYQHFHLFNELDKVISLVILFGVISSGVSNNCIIKRVGIIFSLMAMLPVTIKFFLMGENYQLILAALSLLYTGIVALGGVQVSKALEKNIRLSHDHKKLLNEYKDSERLRIESERETFESYKFASIGKLASGVAHEINNPLAIMLGNIDLLELDLKDSSLKQKKFLEKITSSAKRIKDIVRRMKLLSAPVSTHDQSKSDLLELINDFSDGVSTMLESFGVRLELKIDSTIDKQVHTNIIFQSIYELILNAKHELRPHQGPKIITLEAYINNGNVNINVSDTGLLIPKETVENLFTPFYTSKGPMSNGLGLTIMKATLNKLGYELTYLIKEEKNCFCIQIP